MHRTQAQQRNVLICMLALSAMMLCPALAAQEHIKTNELQYISSDVAACETAREKVTKMLGGFNTVVTSGHMRREGLLLLGRKDKTIMLPYAKIKSVTQSPGTFLNDFVEIRMMRDVKPSVVLLDYPLTPEGNEDGRLFTLALNKLVTDAKAGKPFLCTDDAAELSAALDEFTQKTAAWRAMNPKPADSDAVYKFRLLAEDAVKQEDLAGAARYYQEGVDAEPTWAQGWFNVALVYAQMKRYNEAAFSMKHYVVLLPGADDVRGAKDNIILWEAKAEESVAANPKTPAK